MRTELEIKRTYVMMQTLANDREKLTIEERVSAMMLADMLLWTLGHEPPRLAQFIAAAEKILKEQAEQYERTA